MSRRPGPTSQTAATGRSAQHAVRIMEPGAWRGGRGSGHLIAGEERERDAIPAGGGTFVSTADFLINVIFLE